MIHKERMDEIEKDLSFVLGINTENRSIVDCYDTFHNEQCVGHIKYLLTRVKVLTEALELILSCEPTDKNGEYDLINQNQFWKACKALGDE